MKITAEEARAYSRFGRRFSSPIFFLIFGIALLLFTVLMLPNSLRGLSYPKTKATITQIDTSDPDNKVVYVQYFVDGQSYEGRSNTYAASYKVGKEITIRYNPSDPSEIGGGTFILTLIMAVVGIGSLSFALRTLRGDKGPGKSRAAGRADAEPGVNEIPDESVDDSVNRISAASALFLDGFRPCLSADTPRQTYYFHFGGKHNQGHILETTDYQPVYEANQIKFSLFGNCTFNFTNHLTGVTTEHLVGKTVSITTSRRSHFSYFNFDGEKIWDLLDREGYLVDTEISGLKPRYTLRYGDTPIAILQASGSSIMKNVKANKLTDTFAFRGFFVIETAPDNVPIAFLTAMAFARTDQVIGQ